MPQVFISHSSSDRAFVEHELVPLLEHHAIATWYSREAITTAALWEKEIRLGLNSSDWFLVVLSMHSAKSEWVQAEVQWALEKRKDRLIPVVISDCDPVDTHLQLIRFQYVDFRVNLPAARARLLSIWDQTLEDERAVRVELALETLSVQKSIVHAIERPLLIFGGATIGRDPTAELCLSVDRSVSRRHAELKVRVHEGCKSLWLIDLASKHGIWVNGARISAPTIIEAGDVIRIGSVQIRVRSIADVNSTMTISQVRST